MKIAIFAQNAGGSHWYRAEIPAKYLQQLGHTVDIITDVPVDKKVQSKFNSKGILKTEVVDAIVEDAIHDYDVFIFQRYYFANPALFVGLIQYAKEHKILVVYDVDDLLTEVPKHNPVFLEAMSPSIQMLVKYFFENADLITTSTQELSDKYGGVTLPNSLDFDYWDTKINHKRYDKPCVLWAGGGTHMRDLHMLAPSLKKFQDRMHLIMFGLDPKIEDLEYEFHPFMAHDRYPFLLKKLGADIGVIPLENSNFNQFKSNVKFLEYSACKVASLVSNQTPYRNVIEGKTGMLFSSPNEFEDKLDTLLKNDKIRVSIGKKAYEYAKNNFDMKTNIRLWEMEIQSKLVEVRQKQTQLVNS